MTIRISALYLQVLLIYRFVMQWLAFSFYRTIKMLLLKPRWLNLQLTVQSTCTFNIPIVVLALQRMKIPWRTQNDNWTGDMFSSVDREWWFRPSVNSWRWAFIRAPILHLLKLFSCGIGWKYIINTCNYRNINL